MKFICVHLLLVCVLSMLALAHCRRHSFIWRIISGYWLTQQHPAHVILYCLDITEAECAATTASTKTTTTFKPISHFAILFVRLRASSLSSWRFQFCLRSVSHTTSCVPRDIFVCHWYCVTFDVRQHNFFPLYPSDRTVDIMNNFSLLFVLSTLIHLTYSLSFFGQVLLSANTELGPLSYCLCPWI